MSMQQPDKESENSPVQERIAIVLDIIDNKSKYKRDRRTLLLFILFTATCLMLIVLAIVLANVFGNTNFYGWFIFAAVILVIGFLILLAYFFIEDPTSFSGLRRLRDLISLREEIDKLQTTLRMLDEHAYQQLSPQQRYKNQLPQEILRYQRQANYNRRINYIFQTLIILLSLLVTGLTSGLTGLIGIIGKPWIAPILSLLVSFLTAILALFKFHDRSFNLQQTSDAIELENNAAELHIFHYKGMSDEDALTQLAERAERLKDEQRKRQQQLEQPSETKQPTK